MDRLKDVKEKYKIKGISAWRYFRKKDNVYYHGKGWYHPSRKNKRSKNASNWKDGKWRNRGYIYILMHEHPHCNKNGYIGESRLIVESQIGRYLKPEEECHHIGIKYPIKSIENKQDNRPENLIAFINKSSHHRFHGNPANVKPEEIIFDGRKLNQPASI